MSGDGSKWLAMAGNHIRLALLTASNLDILHELTKSVNCKNIDFSATKIMHERVVCKTGICHKTRKRLTKSCERINNRLINDCLDCNGGHTKSHFSPVLNTFCTFLALSVTLEEPLSDSTLSLLSLSLFSLAFSVFNAFTGRLNISFETKKLMNWCDQWVQPKSLRLNRDLCAPLLTPWPSAMCWLCTTDATSAPNDTELINFSMINAFRCKCLLVGLLSANGREVDPNRGGRQAFPERRRVPPFGFCRQSSPALSSWTMSPMMDSMRILTRIGWLSPMLSALDWRRFCIYVFSRTSSPTTATLRIWRPP